MIYHGLAAFALVAVLVGAVVASLAWTKPVDMELPATERMQALEREIAELYAPVEWTTREGKRRVWNHGMFVFEFDDAAMAERKPGGDVAFYYVHDYTPAVAELADENTTYCDAWGRS